jgi:hypothetical protein
MVGDAGWWRRVANLRLTTENQGNWSFPRRHYTLFLTERQGNRWSPFASICVPISISLPVRPENQPLTCRGFPRNKWCPAKKIKIFSKMALRWFINTYNHLLGSPIDDLAKSGGISVQQTNEVL